MGEGVAAGNTVAGGSVGAGDGGAAVGDGVAPTETISTVGAADIAVAACD